MGLNTVKNLFPRTDIL